MIKLTYKQVGSFEFSQALAKIANTPTSTKQAGHIHQVVKRVQAGKDQIHAEYKTQIVEKFAQKDDKGKVLTGEDHATGFQMMEGKDEEFQKALAEFEGRQVEVDWRPLTPDTLSDVKLSAREIDLLGPLFSEENGPGVPPLTLTR